MSATSVMAWWEGVGVMVQGAEGREVIAKIACLTKRSSGVILILSRSATADITIFRSLICIHAPI